MFNLLEDNKDIDSLISHFQSKAVLLRNKGLLDKNSNLYKEIENTSQEIGDWMETYLLTNKEISKDEEEDMINKILDITHVIETILNKNK